MVYLGDGIFWFCFQKTMFTLEWYVDDFETLRFGNFWYLQRGYYYCLTVQITIVEGIFFVSENTFSL